MTGVSFSFLIFVGIAFGMQAAAADEAAPAAVEDIAAETTVLSGDIAAGEDLYKEVCKACHGPTAKGMASFPKLADKEADYLMERLMQYRAGEKVGPNSALMMPIAGDLSDQDIADVAIFIAEGFD